jgi:hypothetical protein
LVKVSIRHLDSSLTIHFVDEKSEASEKKPQLAKEDSKGSLNNLIDQFNEKQAESNQSKNKLAKKSDAFWGDFDALNDTDQIESIKDIGELGASDDDEKFSPKSKSK